MGYTTGRDEDQKLVFFKNDRNTPENIREFNEGTLSEVINDISSSLSEETAVGSQDISSYLDEKLTILTPTISDRQDVTDEDNNVLYYYETTTYKLQYDTSDMQMVFAEYETYYVDNITDDPYIDPITNEPKPIRWTNVINLSQLIHPNPSGQKIDPIKARQVLDTTIFELLPSQKTRQDEINEFFGDFNSLIGDPPAFTDVDDDGVGEQIQDPQIEKRISTAPDNPDAFITRIDEESNEVNIDKTLESMRNRLNQYLGDVDNVVEEIQDERLEYENKAGGFLQIRKPNQAIIIRDREGEELEFQKDNSFLTNGFTITQWVRFVGKTGGGTLFSFGNPYKEDIENRYGFRLETFTEQNDEENYERFVRLVVWDHIDVTEDPKEQFYGKLYDSHFGIGGNPRINTVSTYLTGSFYEHDNNPAYNLNRLRYKYNHLQIPTDNLDEWYFICATYDPTVDEVGSFNFIEENEGLLYNKDFWLGHVSYILPITGNAKYKQAQSFTNPLDPEISEVVSPRLENFTNVTDIDAIFNLASGTEIKITYQDVNDPFITTITREQGDLHYGAGKLVGALQIGNSGWPDNVDITFQIGEDFEPQYVAKSGLGARCKVEVISRSELLRARGYKVDKFDVPLEGG